MFVQKQKAKQYCTTTNCSSVKLKDLHFRPPESQHRKGLRDSVLAPKLNLPSLKTTHFNLHQPSNLVWTWPFTDLQGRRLPVTYVSVPTSGARTVIQHTPNIVQDPQYLDSKIHSSVRQDFDVRLKLRSKSSNVR